jgi:hypothetical protein
VSSSKRQATGLNILPKNCCICGKELPNLISAVKNRPIRPMRFEQRREMIVMLSVRMMKHRAAVISRGKTNLPENPIGTSEMAPELHHLYDEFYLISISGL